MIRWAERLVGGLGLAAITLAAGVALAPEAAAEAPWALPLTPEQEQAFLERALEGLAPDDPARAALPEAAAAGMLVAHGHCESSGTVRQDLSAEWLGEVESVATVELANASDQPIWLIELGISSKRDYEELAALASASETGAWSANLPFLPPHSSTKLQMGCNDLFLVAAGSDGMSFDALTLDSQPGLMTRRLAQRLVETPARFNHSAKWGKLVGASRPSGRSLAEIALPLIERRADARILAEAVYAADEDGEVLPRLLGAAELEAAHGIVDMLETIPGDALLEFLDATLPHRSELNDEALGRLAGHVCAGLEAEARRTLVLDTMAETGRLWKIAFLGACALEEGDSLHVVDALLEDPKGRYGDNDEALAQFIELARAEAFTAALPTLLGAREPGTPIPGEGPEVEFEIEGQPEPAPEPGEGAGEGEGEEQDEVEIDGGKRPAALWRALSWPPADPERQAALEQLIRAEDVAKVLGELVPTQMNPERLALFDRVAARVDELPEAERGAALAPVLQAGLDSPYLEPELSERLFELSEHARGRLRPIMLAAMAKNQELFTQEALLSFEHTPDELMALFTGPLDGCALNMGTLETCLDAIEGDPQLRGAAEQGGLRERARDQLARLLARPDPSPRQRALIDRVVPYGVSTDPAAEAVCARYEELAVFDLERDEHLDFLRTVTPDHPCLAEIEGAEMSQRVLVIGLGVGVVGAGVLGGLLAWRRRRRTAELLNEL